MSAWLAGLAVICALSVICSWSYPPPLAKQRFTLQLPTDRIGETEPLVVTGRAGEADFLLVRYLDEHTVSFKYDSWGTPALFSDPVPINYSIGNDLEITMPSLAAVVTNAATPASRLLIRLNGKVVWDTQVSFHWRALTELTYGENKLSEQVSIAQFHGELIPLAPPRLTFFKRWLQWLSWGRWQVLIVCVTGAAVVYAGHLPLRSFAHQHFNASAVGGYVARHGLFIITSLFCATAFALMVTGGTLWLIYPESFGGFFDHQAISLLHGRLDVLRSSLCGEEFVYEGKYYGYFGITPALLRMPLIIFGGPFRDVSRLAMLGYQLATLVGAYLVLLDMVRLLRPSKPHPTGFETVLFTLHVGIGSTVFFLGSRAFAYHEAILCGLMFAVWACWCALRHLANPGSQLWWKASLVCGLLSIHARPPVGLFALSVLAACALLPVWREFQARRMHSLLRPLFIAGLAGASVLSFNALSYAKFGTGEGCPLRLNVQYNAARLAKIEGKQFHLSNIDYGLDVYLFRPRILFRKDFPWLFMPEIIPPEEYPKAKIDLADYTMALPVSMPGLFLLASLGCFWAIWLRPDARLLVIALSSAFLLVLLAMCAAIAEAQRYTGEFVPFLICAGAIGLALFSWRLWGLILLTFLTLWACALSLAVTFNYQAKVIWGVDPTIVQHHDQIYQKADQFFRSLR